MRHCGIITGLPDAYGRGRIIGDYRRVALYGIDSLIAVKQADKEARSYDVTGAEDVRILEELYEQIAFLGKLKDMAKMYGYNISAPATNAREAYSGLFRVSRRYKEADGAG